MKKAILIVLDGVGAGEMPDAREFGDEGSATLLHTYEKTNMQLPHMEQLGLKKILNMPGGRAAGCYGKAAEVSKAKDTITGHYEIAGVIVDKPYKTFPGKLPDAMLREFEQKAQVKVLGGFAASGTEIIKQLGAEHEKTDYPIVYTSQDSVFQIAASEQTFGLERLYHICEIAREMLDHEDYHVGRVIARPFIKTSEGYVRTENRKDYAKTPPRPTILDYVKDSGREVVAIGKIEDIFAGQGITKIDHTRTNQAGIQSTLSFINQQWEGLLFTNLVDFDMLFGHRNNPEGMKSALEEFDTQLPALMEAMGEQDILIITADHGCDPTTPSTDHSREYIPILVYGKQLKQGMDIGIRQSFSDIGATIAQYFGLTKYRGDGTSFYDQVKQ